MKKRNNRWDNREYLKLDSNRKGCETSHHLQIRRQIEDYRFQMNEYRGLEHADNQFVELENQISIENEIEKLNFNYELINPRAEILNFDLGIEVTDPKIAQNKENIDPQHGQNPDINTSAIEEALKFDLNSLKENAVLATIRPDADSVGAMAVIELRKNEITIDESLVSAIGKVDSYGFKKAIEDYPEISPRKKEITAASQYCLGKNSIEEKVKFMKRILANKANWEEIEKINKDWETKLEEASKKLTVEELVKDKAVIVKGDHPLAFSLGYEKAGIVTAYNPNFKRPWIENDKESEKWTIARYSEAEKIDIKSLKEQLNALEKQFNGTGSWGGPVNLVASPQGETSKIPYDVIINTIKLFVKTDKPRLCTCGSGEPWHECQGIDGDWSYCG